MKYITKTIQYILPIFIATLITVGMVYAVGNLEPQGTAGDDTHYTLNDIYNKLTTGTTDTESQTSPLTVPGEISATFPTLTEVYNSVPDWLTYYNPLVSI
jgi:hypothetical protein